MASTTAIVKLVKVYQKEHEHIRVYTSKFEEFNRLFKGILIEESVIGLFLNKVRKLLKDYALGS